MKKLIAMMLIIMGTVFTYSVASACSDCPCGDDCGCGEKCECPKK
jgi:hypothetical protein